MVGTPFESRLARTIFLPVGQALEACCLSHLLPVSPGTKLPGSLAVHALSSRSKRELSQEGVHRPAILARAFVNLTMQGLHSLLAPALVFELFGIHKSFSGFINPNLCARQLGKSLDRNREFPYFCRTGLRIRLRFISSQPAAGQCNHPHKQDGRDCGAHSSGRFNFGESKLDSSLNALCHPRDITAKNLADFAELRKEHVMVAALYLAVTILIQPAFCR